MAAAPFDKPGAGSSYAFDIYNDAPSLRASLPPALPSGPCNYTDQTLPRCGCRRFWSRASFSGSGPSAGASGQQDPGAMPSNLAEVCMCSHHACFHEDLPPTTAAQPTQAASGAATNPATQVGQENQRPKGHREPLSPLQDFQSFQMPASLGAALDFNLLEFHNPGSLPRSAAIEEAPRPAESQIPDTCIGWGDLMPPPLIRSDNNHSPMPAQSFVTPPRPPSTASSSQLRYLKPFAGKGLQTLGPPKDARRPAQNADDGDPDATQDAAEVSARDLTPRPDPAALQKLSERVDTHEQRLGSHEQRLESHSQRLDKLESTSFSLVPSHDDCHERYDNVDLRVADLENRVEEMEKRLDDNMSVVASRRGAGADDATASVVSVDSNATVRGGELYTKLQALEATVKQLQAVAPPTYTKPWEVEVVFLPFPLKGIWVSAREFSNRRRSTGDDWTQMPNTLSRSTPDPQSPKFHEWPGQAPDSNALLPKAFPPGKVIDQRLKSRGFIKTILVRGPDFRSVDLAVHEAFVDIFRIATPAPGLREELLAGEYALSRYQALQHPWIPLRKLHKDSRLRFLAPHELITPGLWTFEFLVSSVVMKSTPIQRLYITQPEAYLQDHYIGQVSFESGWTWHKIRQLSRVYPDSQCSGSELSASAKPPESDVPETCWQYHDRLDDPPHQQPPNQSLRLSTHLSRSSAAASSRPSSTEPSFYTGIQSPMMSSASALLRGQSPMPGSSAPIQQRVERKTSVPPRLRLGSVPPEGVGVSMSRAMPSPAQSRRRMSHATPYERRQSPFVSMGGARPSPRPSPRLSYAHAAAGSSLSSSAAAVVAGHGYNKRRFATKSPAPSIIQRNTPRWSRTSLSRSPSLAPSGPYGYDNNRDNRDRERERRGTTPGFYYNTPHSEAVPEHVYGYHRAGSRPPPPPPPPPPVLRSGYEDDGEEEDEEMTDLSCYDDGNGSGTDLYDDDLTAGEENHGRSSGGRSSGRSSRRHSGYYQDEDGDLDFDVYEDMEDDEEEEDELDGIETDGGQPNHYRSLHPEWHGFGSRQRSHRSSYHHHQPQILSSSPQGPLRPEDIPWAGIEDAQEQMHNPHHRSYHNHNSSFADDEDFPMDSDSENHEPTSSSSSSSSSPSSSSSSPSSSTPGPSSASSSFASAQQQPHSHHNRPARRSLSIIEIHEDDPTTTGVSAHDMTTTTTTTTTSGNGSERDDDDDDDDDDDEEEEEEEEEKGSDNESRDLALQDADVDGDAELRGKDEGEREEVEEEDIENDASVSSSPGSSSQAPSEYSSRPPPGAWAVVQQHYHAHQPHHHGHHYHAHGHQRHHSSSNGGGGGGGGKHQLLLGPPLNVGISTTAVPTAGSLPAPAPAAGSGNGGAMTAMGFQIHEDATATEGRREDEGDWP
ncbi:uncharacterized protein CTHT_0063850 [Thermochaetoides thermophila DSM 1495]|uniref:Uncharacterized protein n=1 Tax=Chaetomium thermophilum (strain DSM 1495 / CBS 144.50 / IMI 039719) TaxID=759272 RepID=G0SEI3_CHATD|nr:hypothetical protein CTHT_0063850 [Thermochaetoides thermophila DSM 1495]EGS18360.1 hypothetical protein CTHT_0063850 [Thermochaetoides thermophila DSM 1495]